ncbi:MAG: hypothetical protein AMXMBFR34_48910 [Myxococcaceae bacterium]
MSLALATGVVARGTWAMTDARFLKHLDRQRPTLADELEDDVALLRGLSLAERGKLLESVCRDAAIGGPSHTASSARRAVPSTWTSTSSSVRRPLVT